MDGELQAGIVLNDLHGSLEDGIANAESCMGCRMFHVEKSAQVSYFIVAGLDVHFQRVLMGLVEGISHQETRNTAFKHHRSFYTVHTCPEVEMSVLLDKLENSIVLGSHRKAVNKDGNQHPQILSLHNSIFSRTKVRFFSLLYKIFFIFAVESRLSHEDEKD